MGRTIEDSNGNFIEISDDGFVSVNGNPFGQMTDDREIHPFSGSEVYHINNYDHVIRYSDNADMGVYNGDGYFSRTNTGGGSSGGSGYGGGSYTSSGGGSGYAGGAYTPSGGGSGCSGAGLIVLLIVGVVGMFLNIGSVVGAAVFFFFAAAEQAGSFRGGVELIGNELQQYLQEFFADVPYGETLIKVMGVVLAAAAAILLLVMFILIVAGMVKVLRKSRRPVWHAFIPVLHLYDLFSIACGRGWLFLPALIPLVGVFFLVYLRIRLAKAFGKSGLFTVAFVFFPVICFFALGAGKSRYCGPAVSI